MALDLAPHGGAAVSSWPGVILTEVIKSLPPDMLPEDLRAMLPQFETPEFTGLVIEALSREPELVQLSGKALIGADLGVKYGIRSEEHTSELQSLMRISYAVFCLKKKK